MSISVQYEHLHTFLFNSLFISLFIGLGVGQCEHAITLNSKLGKKWASNRFESAEVKTTWISSYLDLALLTPVDLDIEDDHGESIVGNPQLHLP